VKKRGGVTVAQDPDDASFPDMPRHALQYVPVDYVFPLADIPPLLVRLAQEPVEEGAKPMSGEMKKETDIAQFDIETLESEEKPGTLSAFACPDCGGTLWELQDDDFLRFRCRVGHAFSAESLLATQDGELETALWITLRTLEERATLIRRLADRAREGKLDFAAANFAERAQLAEQQAAVIRKVLLNDKSATQIERSEPS
jgi:two-component system chemotaxis response regulator CheB